MSWKKHALRFGGITAIALGGLAWYAIKPDVAEIDLAKQYGREPVLDQARPEVFPTIKIAKVIGWAAGQTPKAAPGLTVSLFADKLDHPRNMLALPNGDVLVAESTQPKRDTQGVMDWIARKLVMDANGSRISADRITLLRDADKDGVPETRSVLLTAKEGLHSPFGMLAKDGTLYIANTDAILAFSFKPGDTSIVGKGEKIVDLPATLPNNHWTRNLIGTKEGTLLVTVGSNSNIGENGMESEKNRAAILEVFPDKKSFRTFAYGLRNPTGLAVEPKTGYIWTTVNERDMLGSDGPSDYFATVEFGTFYGWPWYYWGNYEDQRTETKRPDLQQYSRRPNYGLGPHTASLGVDFADGAKLGPNFTNGAFIAQHGSWNRVPVSGYKVIYVPFNERGFPADKTPPVDVLTGFLNAKGEAMGRPAGVTITADGSLLVADDSGNRIWRVSGAPSATGK